jgi:hypothetical protein
MSNQNKEEIEKLKKEIEDLKQEREIDELKVIKETLTSSGRSPSSIDFSRLTFQIFITFILAVFYYGGGLAVQWLVIFAGYFMSTFMASALNEKKYEESKKNMPFFQGASLGGCGLFLLVFIIFYIILFIVFPKQYY